LLKEYISVDLEMSGLNPKEDRIIEIGAVKVINGEVTEHFTRLVNPHRKISPEIRNLTGLTNEELEDGVEDWEAICEFIDFAGELPFVGHHIISDVSFIRTVAANHKVSVPNPVVDTLDISRKLLPHEQKKSLEALCVYAEIDRSKGHRAYDDAYATHLLLQWMMKHPTAEEKWFLPRQLIYKVKKQGPITKAQVRQLTELIAYHKLDLDIEIGSLTKNEASRKIDKILFTYGRIPKA